MTTKLTDEQVNAIEQALNVNDPTCGGEVRAYSGRNMYGKSCLGIVTDDPTKCMLVLARNLVITGEQDVLDMLASTWHRQDSMGRSSTVIYFPNLAMDDDEDDQ